MPTKATPRRSTHHRGTARFSRTQPTRPSRMPQRPAVRGGRSRSRKQQSGLQGLIGSAMTALPSKGSAKKRTGGSKAKPAFAMLAAGAGALLGRRRMQKRKYDDAATVPPVGSMQTSVPPTAVPPTSVPPAAS